MSEDQRRADALCKRLMGAKGHAPADLPRRPRRENYYVPGDKPIRKPAYTEMGEDVGRHVASEHRASRGRKPNARQAKNRRTYDDEED
jgi:hypothetical protein